MCYNCFTMKNKSKANVAALIGRTGPEAAIALRERKTKMDDRRIGARNRTRAARKARALENN